MPVYVDDVRIPYSGMIMCHMWADTPAELHAMADAIAIKRTWFQAPPKASWEHYDICLSKKLIAIYRGAILTDRFGPSEHVARRRVASGKPDLVAIGQRRLDLIRDSRAKRSAPRV